MTLDTGDNAADLAGYLEELAPSGCRVDRTVEAVCAGCSGRGFRLRVDHNECAAERTCADCAQVHLMLDTTDYWNEPEPEDVPVRELVGGRGTRR